MSTTWPILISLDDGQVFAQFSDFVPATGDLIYFHDDDDNLMLGKVVMRTVGLQGTHAGITLLVEDTELLKKKEDDDGPEEA